MIFKIDKGLINILVLSWGFMFTFSSFQTMSNTQKNLLDAVEKDKANFTGDGYVSLAIVFVVFGMALFFSPMYGTLISTKLSLLLGALCNLVFTVIFFWPESTLLYVGSAIQGVGNALMWVSSGRALTENSKPATISRNAGIFWATFQLSLVTGNLFVYFTFTGKSFDEATRKTILITLTVLSTIGCSIFTGFKGPPRVEPAEKTVKLEDEKINDCSLKSAWLRMRNAALLVFTENMMLLSISFLYTGLIIAFYTGVYTSVVGFTVKLGDIRKRLVNLTGVAIGIGAALGATFSGSLAPKLKICSNSLILVFGFSAQIVCFIITYLNFPNNAPFEDTEDIGVIAPMPALAIIGGFFLGFGDSCINIQIYNVLGTIYKEDIAPAFAFFCFCQSITVTLSFVGSNYIGLHIQLITFIIVGILGIGCFIFVNLRNMPIHDDTTSAEKYIEKNSSKV